MALAEAGTVAEAASGGSRPVRFIGPEKEYWRIVVRGAVLLMVTLGLYRFWLATDVRRFLWANTEVEGESLEYNGTALELLQGFLFAIALVLPIYTVFTITVLDLGDFGNFLSATAVLLLAFMSQYGIYLARRYRLTRTVFRGLRFRQTGSGVRYSICAVWWWGWTALTIGFAYPFTRAALERFKMRNTWYGDIQGRFEGSGWRLFIRGFFMWLVVLIPALMTLGAVVSINWSAASAAMRGGGDVLGRLEKASPGFTGYIGLAIITLLITIVMIALVLPAFHAMVMRWWVSGIRFGDIVLTSHLRKRDVYLVYLRFIGWVAVFAVLMLVGIFFALLFIGMFAQDNSVFSEFATVAFLVGVYVVSVLGLITLYNAVVTLSVWRLTAESIELTDTAAIARAKASGEASSPLGEGIADVLNLGGI